ncbi:MAG TPA: hypothetical protein VEX38_10230, partial [Fimbriimonadaceae bacterium]|nr:hypothetical protein [Fimbriimonadaceae bacterium]
NLATQPVGTTVQRTVSATLADVTRTAVLTVTTSLYTLSVNPSTVKGGNSTTGTVTLTGPATAGGQPVNIWSDSSAFVLPQTVTVPAGNSSTTFTVGTKPVGATVTRYLKATLGGTTRTAAVTLTP